MTPQTDEMEVVRRYLQSAPPVDIVSLIRELGIDYREAPLGAGNSGRIDRLGDRFRITVNSDEGPQRRRFTAAHELAHYLLHRDLLRHGHADRLFGFAATENPTEPFARSHEVQANRLAADLIMPRSSVYKRFSGPESIRAVADAFAVSSAAMEIRLKNLGLLPN